MALPRSPLTVNHPQAPPLESGDSPAETRCERLTRHEFERHYQAATRVKKAELIEGVVYVPAARHFKSHAEPHGNLIGCTPLRHRNR